MIDILHNRTRYLIVLLLIFVNMVSNSQTLTEYLTIAAENNQEVKSKFSSYMASMQRVSQVGALPDPQIAFGYFVSPIETRNGPQVAKVSLTQRFPWFGTLKLKRDVSSQKALAQFQLFEEAKSKLYYNVKSAYYNLYFLNQAIDIATDNIKILETFKNIAYIKIEAGSASAVDGLRAKMELLSLQDKLKSLTDLKILKTVQFNNLLHRNPYDSVAILKTISTIKIENVDIIKMKIVENNHSLKRFDHIIQSSKIQQKVAKKLGMPNISLGIDYAFIGESDNVMSGADNGKDAIVFPKLGLSVPIFRKKYNAMIKESAFLMEVAVSKKSARKDALLSLLQKVITESKDATRRVGLNENLHTLAKESLIILEAAYTTSGKNFEEILRMERKVLNYALNIEKAKTDQLIADAFLKYLKGDGE